MSDRALEVVIAASIVVMLVLVVWTAFDRDRAVRERDAARAQRDDLKPADHPWLRRSPDGSGECKAGTLAVPTTVALP